MWNWRLRQFLDFTWFNRKPWTWVLTFLLLLTTSVLLALSPANSAQIDATPRVDRNRIPKSWALRLNPSLKGVIATQLATKQLPKLANFHLPPIEVAAPPVVAPVPSDVEIVPLPTGKLLSLPVNGPVTSKFGMRFHPILHEWKLHSGVDFGAPCGTAIGAAAPGTVISAQQVQGYGKIVAIDHGIISGVPVTTRYAHLSSFGVAPGDTVVAHQGIGRVGNSGYSTGCHLHFEVIIDDLFVDPLQWLNGNPVRISEGSMSASAPRHDSSSTPTPAPSSSFAPPSATSPRTPTAPVPPPPAPISSPPAAPVPSTPVPSTPAAVTPTPTTSVSSPPDTPAPAAVKPAAPSSTQASATAEGP